MTDENIIFIYFLLCIIIGISCIIIAYIRLKNEEKVTENSKNIKLLLKLNDITNFNKYFNNNRSFHCRTYSKRNLEKMTFDTIFNEELQKNYNNLINDMEILCDNFNKYKEYEKYYEMINEKTELNEIEKTNLSEERFYKIEKRMMQKYKIKDVCKYAIKITIDYLSPKGRNYYIKDKLMDYSEIITLYLNYKKKIELGKSYEMQVRIERSKVNDSLRYEVFKKNNYRCCICGASASEGAKLHVDHIIPVSKGGKTTIDNLQTLCDRCNMGKSNKML